MIETLEMENNVLKETSKKQADALVKHEQDEHCISQMLDVWYVQLLFCLLLTIFAQTLSSVPTQFMKQSHTSWRVSRNKKLRRMAQ